MRVLVTGGSGRLGREAINELLMHDHEVVNADRSDAAREPRLGYRFVQTDLTDIGQVAGSMHGCDAVVHLGAIPAPYGHPDEVVFHNNTMATFAVLQAASLLGVGRAAIASSVSAYGMAWTPRPFGPRYAPLDEAHPLLVHDPYGLSKEVDERIAEMMHRRSGLQIAALRFHWVALPEELESLDSAGLQDPGAHANNLWGYVDVRDAASACRHAVEQGQLGFEAFNITAGDTLCTDSTEVLIRRHLPDTNMVSQIEGTATAISIDKAKRMLGWQPRHSWRAL